MGDYLNRFILMVQFFTRIPVNKTVPVEKEDFRTGSIYFPVIGLIVGLVSALAYLLVSSTGNMFLSSIIAVLASVMVTGALHVDGLADTCDGVFSSRSKEKMLEIMKDSRIGTMGAIAIIFLVLAKVALIWGMNYRLAIASVIIAPVISRTSMLYGITIAKYPRENGLGKTFIGNVTSKEFAKGLIICTLMIIPAARLFTPLFIAAVAVVPRVFNRYIENRIGGMTGDTLGALNEIQEVLCLLMLSLMSGYIWR